MTYTHKMSALPAQYDQTATEKKWQRHWHEKKIYAWINDDHPENDRDHSYVIDTPPPTVSGTLHMGHVFSYTQADFIARFQRMMGKNVFYPMGFDDNGLPTERLVEKTKKIRAADMSREEFINVCLGVSEEARKEFRELFESIALSVDWDQEYHTISDSSRRLSQLSFLDLVNKGHCYRALRPFYWDPVDQTAIASAEIVDKEMPSFENVILFTVIPAQAGISLEANASVEGDSRLRGNDAIQVPVMTTRPELLPACVALMYHPDDAAKYAGKKARTPLFNIEVPMVADEKVNREKGTGLVMCCTFGDDTDKEWWEKHKLATRVILNKYGKLDPALLAAAGIAPELIALIQNKKTSNPDPKNQGAREIILAALKEAGLLTEQKPITHAVKTAERSGAPLEILPSEQWFVRLTDKKDELTARARAAEWKPEWMRLRIEQWIDGLAQDWCISRQRYFGVPFPVWYKFPVGNAGNVTTVYAQADELPVNPLNGPPRGYSILKDAATMTNDVNPSGMVTDTLSSGWLVKGADGIEYRMWPDLDVMDTWATSSISPQLSAGAISSTVIPAQAGISLEANASVDSDSRLRGNDDVLTRFHKLFPADLRPQAHEIIRTWAFYTLVKAHLHNHSIPWKNLMISGWCLAEDKSKMSKSKGNVITPTALIEEKGTDAVRYWAATSRLGQDTAFSPDLLKIGKKLVGKLWNATQFAAIHLTKLSAPPLSVKEELASGRVSEVLDRWILSRLAQTVTKASESFAAYEYADALDATNQFFWADFCDNYLELIKKRVYNEDGSASPASQQSAVIALYLCLQGILKLYAPFVPHVTEELYSHIFVDDYAASGSLHSRGQWPAVSDYGTDEASLTAGKAAVHWLEQIRKKKSDNSKSIKFPVSLFVINLPSLPGVSKEMAASMLADLKSAGNIIEIQWIPPKEASQLNAEAAFEITLADEADAA